MVSTKRRGVVVMTAAGVGTNRFALGSSRARFVEVFAQIGFRLGARPLGRVHRDDETRNGTNGSSTTSCLPVLVNLALLLATDG
eukprot:scaffold40312_cov100-Phaeocystis_antarctica.AAC.2